MKILGLIAAFILIVAGFFCGYYGYIHIGANKLADLGQFLSGTTGILWSLASFCLVFVAFLEQRGEIKANSISQSEERFERNFFQLLALHTEIVKDTMLLRREGGAHIEGRRCFKILYGYFADSFPAFDPSLRSDEKRIEATYEKLFQDYQPQLGHYFRNLYHVVKYVDDSQISNKLRYVKILRAQLSSAELLLLFYNGLSPYGVKSFKPLIERYSLLAPMPISELLDASHKRLYAVSAYTDSP